MPVPRFDEPLKTILSRSSYLLSPVQVAPSLRSEAPITAPLTEAAGDAKQMTAPNLHKVARSIACVMVAAKSVPCRVVRKLHVEGRTSAQLTSRLNPERASLRKKKVVGLPCSRIPLPLSPSPPLGKIKRMYEIL